MASLVNYAALNNGRVVTVASSSDYNGATSGAEVISMADYYIALHGNTVALDSSTSDLVVLDNGHVGTVASSSDSDTARASLLKELANQVGATIGAEVGPIIPISMAEYIALHGNTVALLDNGRVGTGTSSSDSNSATSGAEVGTGKYTINIPNPASVVTNPAVESDTGALDSSTSDTMTSSSDSDTATSGAEVSTGNDTINIPNPASVVTNPDVDGDTGALDSSTSDTGTSSSDSDSATSGAEVGTGSDTINIPNPASVVTNPDVEGDTENIDSSTSGTGASSSDSDTATSGAEVGTGKYTINIPNPASVVTNPAVESDTGALDSSTSDTGASSSDSDTATSGAEVGTGSDTINIPNPASVVANPDVEGDPQIFNKKKTGVTFGENYSETEFDGSAYTALVTIDGSAAENDIFFTGNSKANKIYGGAGNDTLWGGAGNNTLTGNAGSDTFVYSAGKNVITDFDAATDKISIEGGVEAITNATFSGDASDTLILTINKQTLKIQSADGTSLANTEITLNDAAYTFDKNLISDGTSVTMYSAFKGAYTAASDIITVDGSVANGAMNITANDSDNIIYGGRKADTLNGGAGNDMLVGGAGKDSIFGNNGNDKIYGDAGNDYIEGGAGNDTLVGGAGRDIFVFGADEGEDLIQDYTAGEDKIKLINGAEISNVSYDGENVIFEVGSGKITVENAKGSAIKIIDSRGRTTTQIYTDEESAAARALDLIYDNNFMTDDAALDDITEAKYSVTDIEADSKDELEKAQALLTFSEDK